MDARSSNGRHNSLIEDDLQRFEDRHRQAIEFLHRHSVFKAGYIHF